VSRHQNVGQDRNIKTVTKSFRNVETFTYLRTRETNKNYVHKEINNRSNSVNTWYRSDSAQCLVPAFRCQKVKIKLTLHVVLYGCET
jgi:hypothetical protein